MLQIMAVGNPKKRKTRKKRMAVKRKRKVICAKKNSKPETFSPKVRAKLQRKLKRILDPKRKPKILRAKKNLAERPSHETIIVGYSTYPGPNYNKTKRWFYDGVGFTRNKNDAMYFPGDGAKLEAKRIQYKLPREIYAIRVEKA